MTPSLSPGCTRRTGVGVRVLVLHRGLRGGVRPDVPPAPEGRVKVRILDEVIFSSDPRRTEGQRGPSDREVPVSLPDPCTDRGERAGPGTLRVGVTAPELDGRSKEGVRPEKDVLLDRHALDPRGQSTQSVFVTQNGQPDPDVPEVPGVVSSDRDILRVDFDFLFVSHSSTSSPTGPSEVLPSGPLPKSLPGPLGPVCLTPSPLRTSHSGVLVRQVPGSDPSRERYSESSGTLLEQSVYNTNGKMIIHLLRCQGMSPTQTYFYCVTDGSDTNLESSSLFVLWIFTYYDYSLVDPPLSIVFPPPRYRSYDRNIRVRRSE